MDENTTVYIVDDDQAVRESLGMMVSAMRLRAACYSSAEEFLEQYDRCGPGCLLLDIRMPGMSGFDLQERLIADNIRLPIIIVTGHGDVPMSVRAMKRGAIDFLEKPCQPHHLRRSIQQAIEKDVLERREQSLRRQARDRLDLLTDDEREVMEGIVSGKPNKTIAKECNVSLRTIQFRRSRLMKKLEVDSRAALVQLVFSAR